MEATKPCPVCGRLPDIKSETNSESQLVFTLYCDDHLSASASGGAEMLNAWNAAVDAYVREKG